jgi:DNA-binding response OmpR family regulator
MVCADMADIGEVGATLAYGMRQAGWKVVLGQGAESLRREASGKGFHVVMLYASGQAMAGLIRQMRAHPSGAKALLIAMPTDGGPAQRIAALEAGADLCCPAVTPAAELSAMLHAVLRRLTPALPRAAQWRLEDAGRLLLGPGDLYVPLTYAENRLLKCLLENPGVPLPRADKRFGGGRAIDVTVSRLRAKAAALGVCLPLLTVREMGYMFLSEDDAQARVA